MTIKLRITLGFLCSIAIVAACVIGYTGWQMRKDARGYFITASGQQLRLMDENINSFVSAASHNAQIVAELPGLAGAKDVFPRFVDNPRESRYRQSDLSPEARALTETLLRVGRANALRGVVRRWRGNAPARGARQSRLSRGLRGLCRRQLRQQLRRHEDPRPP